MTPEKLVRACLGEMHESDGIAVSDEVAGAKRSAVLGALEYDEDGEHHVELW